MSEQLLKQVKKETVGFVKFTSRVFNKDYLIFPSVRNC